MLEFDSLYDFDTMEGLTLQQRIEKSDGLKKFLLRGFSSDFPCTYKMKLHVYSKGRIKWWRKYRFSSSWKKIKLEVPPCFAIAEKDENYNSNDLENVRNVYLYLDYLATSPKSPLYGQFSIRELGNISYPVDKIEEREYRLLCEEKEINGVIFLKTNSGTNVNDLDLLFRLVNTKDQKHGICEYLIFDFISLSKEDLDKIKSPTLYLNVPEFFIAKFTVNISEMLAHHSIVTKDIISCHFYYTAALSEALRLKNLDYLFYAFYSLLSNGKYKLAYHVAETYLKNCPTKHDKVNGYILMAESKLRELDCLQDQLYKILDIHIIYINKREEYAVEYISISPPFPNTISLIDINLLLDAKEFLKKALNLNKNKKIAQQLLDRIEAYLSNIGYYDKMNIVDSYANAFLCSCNDTSKYRNYACEETDTPQVISLGEPCFTSNFQYDKYYLVGVLPKKKTTD